VDVRVAGAVPSAGDNGSMSVLVVDSPVGQLTLTADAGALVGVRFGAVDPATKSRDAVLVAVRAQLMAYFAGRLTDFTVPVVIRRGSEFERAVWAELARIPYGEMRTYGDIAKAVGDSGAARAVGTACNRNPVPVIVPCHRVVGAGGKLVGFGGGLPRKRQLLELEARVALERAWG
jgi:methylated-DNA-[protein]-cysteine S-methyltransferase